MKVSTVAQMRDLDKSAMEEFGISADLLMENAGQAAYSVILKELGITNKRFVVFCGAGNNGGDGLVIARKIHSNGGEVTVFLLGDETKFKGAAERNFEIVSKLPVEIRKVDSIRSMKPAVLHSDAIIDAIFGTGLARKVDGIYKDYEYCGRLYVSHISFPPSLYDTDSIRVATNNPIELPRRAKDAHKGDFGEVLFIAGASSYLGAPYFSALSFLKAGGGYSRLATPLSISSFLANKGSEIVFAPQRETSSGSIALENKDRLLELSQGVDMVVIGPGLSLNEETQELVRELALEIQKPVLIDGDGITAISKDIEMIKARKSELVLTPHLGEMSRITKVEISELNKNKVEVLQHTARELDAIIVLKGAHSLIGYPDETVFINPSGNPGMATAGAGDVLTGTIAAMFGLGLTLRNSVRMGVFVHGFAGDLAAADKGEDGTTAQDILDYLPAAMKYYRANFDEISKNLYDSILTI